MTAIADRVAAGAAFLDNRRPGWDELINLRRLSLISDCNCVIGQVTGRGFFFGALELGLTGKPETDALGFTGIPAEYELLTGEWYRVIADRREAA